MPILPVNPIPFFDGVSRQPATARHENQVEEAFNAVFSVVNGFSNRPGSYHLSQLDKNFRLSVANWTASSRTLTELNAFINYTHQIGDVVYISGGKNVKWGLYEIASKVDASQITLSESISETDLNNSDITSGLIPGENYRIHTIERDNEEQYLVIYGQRILRVFDVFGREQRVKITDAARTYMNKNPVNTGTGVGPDEQVIVTIADHSIIANKSVSMRTAPSPRFDITTTQDDYEALIATTPANNTYHRTKKPGGAFPAGYYKYFAGTSTLAKWYGKTVGPGFIEAWSYDDARNNPGKFKITFVKPDQFQITTGNWTEATLTLTATGKFAGYTHAAGDQVYIAGGTGVNAGIYNIASKTSDDAIVLTASIATVPGDLSNNDITTGIYNLVCTAEMNVVDGTFTGGTMNDVAAVFQASLQTFHPNILCAWESISAFSGRFVITGPYVGSGATITGPENTDAQNAGTDPSKRWAEAGATAAIPFSDGRTRFIPNVGPFSPGGDSRIEPGQGDPKANILDVPERWTRVPAPGQKDALIDTSTMPIKLVRQTVAFIDENNAYQPGSWLADSINWVGRLSGGSESNPVPEIMRPEKSNRVADIAFHRNRLGIGSGETIAFSQSGDFFNFFIDDSSNIVDSDPIIVQMNSNSVAELAHMIPFRKSLVMNTKAGKQFELNLPESLTQQTAAVTESTSYATQQDIRPAVIGYNIYLISNTDAYARVYEYFFSERESSNVAADITAHVREYIPPTIKTIVSSSNNQALMLLPRQGSNLYAYQAYWHGNTKLQSAWGTFEFDDSDRIVDIGIIRDNTYMLVEIPGGYILDRLPIPNEPAPYGVGTLFLADISPIDINDFKPISDGSFSITIDGVKRDVSGCDFSAITTQTDIATIITNRIQAVFGTGPFCTLHKGIRYIIASGTSGSLSSVSQISDHSSGTGTSIVNLIGGSGVVYPSRMPYMPHLDRRIELLGTYDSLNNETTWNYDIDDPTLNKVVMGRMFGAKAGFSFDLTRVDDHTVKLEGDWSAGTVTIGRSYKMDVQLSRLYLRDRDGRTISDAEIHYHTLKIKHQNAGYYRVESNDEARGVFQPLAVETEGTFTCGIMGNSDNTNIHIVNDSPLPCTITDVSFSIELERIDS